MYNLKIREYGDDNQIQVCHYNYPIMTKEDKIIEDDKPQTMLEWYFEHEKEIHQNEVCDILGISYMPFIDSFIFPTETNKDGFTSFETLDKKVVKNAIKTFDYAMMSWRQKEEYDRQQEYKHDMNLKRCINNIYDYARCNKWEWFLTFTFKDPNIRYNYIDCRKKLSEWFKNNKKRYAPNLKYIAIPERHQDGAFHFHALCSNIGDIKLKECVYFDTGELYKKNGQQVYYFGGFSYGWSTATEVRDTKRVSGYITKYITKDLLDCIPNKQRYLVSKGLNKPTEEHYTVTDIKDAIKKVMEVYGYLPDVEYVKNVMNVYTQSSQTYYEMKL